MKITIIAAITQNNGLGKNNELLCYLPDDLKRFKQLTTNHTIIMGRKTFESIGKPLPNRQNIVLTHNKNWTHDGVMVYHSMTDLLEMIKKQHETNFYIIGGAKIYELFLPLAQTLEITHINATIEADAFFPEINSENWIKTHNISHPADEKHPLQFNFTTYIRK